jgi:hypothetical protein
MRVPCRLTDVDNPAADPDFDGGELPPEAEARLQALIVEQQARRADEDRAGAARRNLWRTHHWEAEYDRCTVVVGRHVCRRCLTLYPIAIAVMVVSLLGLQPWPERFDVWFIWLLCVPATAEFVAEKLLDVPYSAARQIAVSALVGLALGRGLAYEVDDRWSWYFWGPVLVFGSTWFLAAVTKARNAMFEDALKASLESGELSGRS